MEAHFRRSDIGNGREISLRNIVITNSISLMAIELSRLLIHLGRVLGELPSLSSQGSSVCAQTGPQGSLSPSRLLQGQNDTITSGPGGLCLFSLHGQSCCRVFDLIFSRSWVFDSFLFSISLISALVMIGPFLQFPLGVFCSSFCSSLRWGLA